MKKENYYSLTVWGILLLLLCVFPFRLHAQGENAFSLAGSKRFRATACKIVTGKSCQESRHFFLDLDYVTETDSTVTIKNGGVAQIGC